MSRRKISNLIARKKKQKVREFTGMTNKQWSEWCERRAEGKRNLLRMFAEFFKGRTDEGRAQDSPRNNVPEAD